MQVLGGTKRIKRSLEVRPKLSKITLDNLTYAMLPPKEAGDKLECQKALLEEKKKGAKSPFVYAELKEFMDVEVCA